MGISLITKDFLSDGKHIVFLLSSSSWDCQNMGVAVTMNTQVANNAVGTGDENDLDKFWNFVRYKPRSLDELASRTKFSKKEIQLLYQGFKQDCPYGVVDEETFTNIYQQFFPFADSTGYAHWIFSTFDSDSSGFVTFEDFLICLSNLSRGTTEDRLRWIFTLYDTKRSGRLTKENFFLIISSVYELLGNVSNQKSNPELLRKQTMILFEKFDPFRRGYLTIEDFLSFCLKDPMIIQSIEVLRITA